MIEVSRNILALIGLFCGIWFAAASWIALEGMRRRRAAIDDQNEAFRIKSLLAASPALPLIVYRDGKIEGAPRLLAVLGVGDTELGGADLSVLGRGVTSESLLRQIEIASSSGGTFLLSYQPETSSRIFLVRGAPAPPSYQPGTVLLWFLDSTESEAELANLRNEVERLTQAVDALSGVIEAAPFPIWHRGPDLKIALVNSAYVDAVEAQDAISVVQAGIELVDESEGRSPLSQAAAVKEKGETVSRTVPATIAGERRMMRVVEAPIGMGVAGYAIDVDDREQARADLARFVRAQRDMLDRLSAGVAQFSRDRSLSFFNRPFASLFGLGIDFLADRPEFDRVLDAMREQGNLPEARDYPDWKETRRGWFTMGIAAEEEHWLLPGGKHLRVVAQPLPDGGLVLIFEDRTEQIQLASARDTLLRVRTATFDNLFEAVAVFASDGRLHLWNNRFRELWEFEEDQLTSHPRVDMLTPHIARKLKNAGHAGLIRELVRGATVERIQRNGRLSLTDGRDFDFAAVPLPDGNALFTMLDVTDSRIIESALRERNEALEEADRLKTAFVSNMSYELRTPLTSIAGFAEMLAGGYAGELPSAANEYVQAIVEAVVRLSALIDDVLDLTQSDTGSLLVAEEQVSLEALCTEVAEGTSGLAERKKIAFEVDVDPSIGMITGDRRRLAQALENILKNAFAYTDEGGQVILRASGDDEFARIIVSDNGQGISPTDQARVFDRFHRTADPVGEVEAALGLGLPLAKQFIEAHGGAVELVSEVGKGTKVTFLLPRNR